MRTIVINPLQKARWCDSHKCVSCELPRAYGSIYCYLHKSYSSDSSNNYSYGAESDLEFSNIDIEHNSLYTVVTGTVTNNGTRDYKFVTIKGAFKDWSGKVVDTDSTYAIGSEGLSYGESKTFRMSVDKNTSISKCDISIISYK
jgi:hypothetical protein